MFKTRSLEGYYARTDCFGRLFFDQCATDEEHLTNTKIAPGDDRPRCRVYADVLVPAEDLNKKQDWLITVQTRPATNLCPHGRLAKECHVCGHFDQMRKSWPHHLPDQGTEDDCG